MHKIANRLLLAILLVTANGLGNCQESQGQPPAAPPNPAEKLQTTGAAPGTKLPESMPEPAAESLNLSKETRLQMPTNTIERFTVAPYKIIGTPLSTREMYATVQIERKPGEQQDQLPDSLFVTTKEAVGATTIVLSLLNLETGERLERRIELLVIDRISESYRLYLEKTIQRLFPTSSVRVLVANQRTAVVSGQVDRAEYVQPIVDLVKGFLMDQGRAQPNVVNAIRVTGAQQVQLRVVVAEVLRSKIRELGFDFTWTDLAQTGLIGTLGVSTGVTPNMPFTLTRPDVFRFEGNLRALVSNNLGKLLAEPTLVTMSGQPAFFNVGGEVPVAVSGGFTGGSITFRSFGTNVRFVPTVLGDGRIRLEVRPEVSDLVRVIEGDTFVAPQLNTRVVESTVELENGQTFVLAGLVQQRVDAIGTHIPFLGDLPLVGWAFTNKRYNQEERELVIMVTAYLADAMDESPCKLPGRESRVPNDLEFYLGNKFEPPCFPDPYRDSWKNCDKNSVPPGRPVPMYDNWGKPDPELLMGMPSATVIQSAPAAPTAPAAPAATPAAPKTSAVVTPSTDIIPTSQAKPADALPELPAPVTGAEKEISIPAPPAPLSLDVKPAEESRPVRIVSATVAEAPAESPKK